MRDQNNKLLSDINRYSNEVKSLNTFISEQELKLDEKNSAIVSKDNQINELKTMLIEFENLNNQMEGKLTSMKYSESDLGKMNQELRNQVMQLERELKDAQGKYSELLKTLKMYDQDKDTYSNQLMEKIEANDSLSDQLRSLQREFSELNHK